MNRVPAHLDPADLLAIAEGEVHFAANAKAVRAAIEADPSLGRLLRDMRSDRDLLRAWASSAVTPPGLLDGIESRLEREVIASLARSEPGRLPIPTSSVVVRRPSVWHRLVESRGPRRYAIAAALVLAGVTVSLLVRSALLPPTSDHRRIASVTDGISESTDPDVPAIASHHAATSPDARHDTSDDGQPPERVLASTEPREEPVTDAAAPDAPAKPSMSIARAVELAGQGRLAIRVASSRFGAVEDVRGVASRSPKEIRWKPLDESSGLATALASRIPLSPPAALPTTPAPGEHAVADERDRPPAASPNVTAPSAASAPDPVKPLYVVEFESTQARLSAIVAALGRQPQTHVELVELDEPVGLAPSLDPAAMLWWGRKPAEWVRRVAVPIVLEQRPPTAPKG
ncbi:MAG: hypothetical protein AB7G11_15655 [Phycisphaerales bacterium]